jgi:transmembrane sensor
MPGEPDKAHSCSPERTALEARKVATVFRFRLAVTLIGSLISLACLIWHWKLSDMIIAGVGERRSRILDDGTIVILNTNSRVEPRYGTHSRNITLVPGEASFDVAKDSARPFTVSLGNCNVTTARANLIARHERDFSAVTLISGTAHIRANDDLSDTTTDGMPLNPGERVIFARGSIRPSIEHPNIDAIAAWKADQIRFNDTPLIDAVTELNRYNRLEIRLDSSQLNAIKVSGIYDTHGAIPFAADMTHLHKLGIVHRGGAIHLVPAKVHALK